LGLADAFSAHGARRRWSARFGRGCRLARVRPVRSILAVDRSRASGAAPPKGGSDRPRQKLIDDRKYTMNPLANSQDSLIEVVAALPLDETGDLLFDTAEGLVDIADAAADAAVATGRLGTRIITRTVRLVARHPKKILIGVVLIAAVVGVLNYLNSNQAETS